MKGIVLAGGSGSRLYPITKGITKQLLPVYNKPMIYYPISTLMLADIKDILIITTPEDQESFKRLLGDGSQFGINLNYAVQEKPNGIAEAFIIGKEFIGDDSVCLVLGDNIFHGMGFSNMLKKAVSEAEKHNTATIFGYYVNDPERYGIVDFKKIGNINKIISIEEKPKNPKSNYAVVGLYFYPNNVVKIAETIKPSARGELEITEVNNTYLNVKEVYKYLNLQIFNRGFAWLDTGTFDSLSEASSYIETIEKRQGLKVACLEESAYKNGWISKEKLIEIGNSMSKNEYGQYLLRIAK